MNDAAVLSLYQEDLLVEAASEWKALTQNQRDHLMAEMSAGGEHTLLNDFQFDCYNSDLCTCCSMPCDCWDDYCRPTCACICLPFSCCPC